MSATDAIGVTDIKAAIADIPGQKSDSLLDRSLGDGFSLQSMLENIQRQYLERAMNEAHGVKTRAAELLGIPNYQTLDAQLKRLKVKGDWSH
jgi:DNA-binding NtrC family response regulator